MMQDTQSLLHQRRAGGFFASVLHKNPASIHARDSLSARPPRQVWPGTRAASEMARNQMLLLYVPVQADQIGCHYWHRLSEVLLHCSWTTWGSKEQVQRAEPSFFPPLLSADAELRNDRRGWVKASCQKNKTMRWRGRKERIACTLTSFLVSLENVGMAQWQWEAKGTTLGWELLHNIDSESRSHTCLEYIKLQDLKTDIVRRSRGCQQRYKTDYHAKLQWLLLKVINYWVMINQLGTTIKKNVMNTHALRIWANHFHN